LLKGKILTAKDLKRRGINGPSRCPNYFKVEDTMYHLFIECPFAIECWKKMSSIGNLNWDPQHTIAETIYNRRKCYP